ncbi:hypothetical protein PMIN01_03202 [Paraphaeosphaeria minitans]|uniref:Uncharacterized protein n=1 Tax=Paraphaeosphaeria minitans TaxID=565426 RepID=A0A9P6KTM5_9PLEO|nr:hypothetical protein PMIN01_03202 [Paraphaeosphaeria minitans]
MHNLHIPSHATSTPVATFAGAAQSCERAHAAMQKGRLRTGILLPRPYVKSGTDTTAISLPSRRSRTRKTDTAVL